MGALVQLPKKQNGFSLSDWLDSHMGCDADKMMRGDKMEIEKHQKHLVERNIKERNKMLED